jgi:hypothetical protein
MVYAGRNRSDVLVARAWYDAASAQLRVRLILGNARSVQAVTQYADSAEAAAAIVQEWLESLATAPVTPPASRQRP